MSLCTCYCSLCCKAKPCQRARTMPSLKRMSERPSDTLHTSPSEVVTRTPTTLSVSFSALNSAGCGGRNHGQLRSPSPGTIS